MNDPYIFKVKLFNCCICGMVDFSVEKSGKYARILNVLKNIKKI